MSMFILPDQGLIRHPRVIQATMPEIWAHGGIAQLLDGMVRVLFYVHPSGHQANPVVSIRMTQANFDRSLIIAAVDHLPRVLRPQNWLM